MNDTASNNELPFSPARTDDPLTKMLEHRSDVVSAIEIVNLALVDLDLAEHAKSAAELLKKDFPSVVFTSGRRSVSAQASAMADNVLKNRRWIEQTYAKSAERDELQKWINNNPNATTQSAVAAGLTGIMQKWTDSQRVKLSRHFAGLAFDVHPTADSKLKEGIKALPNLVKFLDDEGGITIWHAEFSAKSA